MEQLPPLGTAISSTAPATQRIYAPLLAANGAAIKSTPRKTFAYGPHARQELDVYYPSPSPSSSTSAAAAAATTSPILLFLYGGGLVRGAKTLTLPNGAAYADGLAHANIGHFFADQLGYTTVIPDYRLMSHGARFPSGGEDVALAVEWARTNLVVEAPRDLFIMGNSAGGLHLSTYLFSPAFAESRRAIRGDGPDAGLRLRGAVMLSVPFHFREALPDRAEMLGEYFGDRVEQDCPLGLMQASREAGEAESLGGLPVLVLNGTLDPEDEILVPKRDFLEEWNKDASPAAQKALTVQMMEGQNHISPALSLGTDIPKEETWGYQVGTWIESHRS